MLFGIQHSNQTIYFRMHIFIIEILCTSIRYTVYGIRYKCVSFIHLKWKRKSSAIYSLLFDCFNFNWSSAQKCQYPFIINTLIQRSTFNIQYSTKLSVYNVQCVSKTNTNRCNIKIVMNFSFPSFFRLLLPSASVSVTVTSMMTSLFGVFLVQFYFSNWIWLMEGFTKNDWYLSNDCNSVQCTHDEKRSTEQTAFQFGNKCEYQCSMHSSYYCEVLNNNENRFMSINSK